jgi:hypothetical protein
LISAAFGYDVMLYRNGLAAGVISTLVGGKQGAGEVYLYSLKPLEQDVVTVDMFSTVELLLILSLVVAFFIFATRARAFYLA